MLAANQFELRLYLRQMVDCGHFDTVLARPRETGSVSDTANTSPPIPRERKVEEPIVVSGGPREVSPPECPAFTAGHRSFEDATVYPRRHAER